MKIITTPQLDFHNVLIRPKRTTISSRSQVDLERDMTFPHSTMTWKGTPIIAANMDTTGTFEVYDVLSKHKMITCFNKFYNLKSFQNRLKKKSLDPDYFMISTGIDESQISNLHDIVELTAAKWICIDVANGYMEQVVNYCQKVRQSFPDKIIVAGNVATREMVEELIINGKVDVVKVGIGPGSACLTRLKTGVGVPQLSAIIECADAAHGLGAHIIADGGCTCPGDVAKAFGAGADFVMLGGMFAGHDEGKGKIVKSNGSKYIEFYGSSSTIANKKHYGGLSDYRSSEGRTVRVKYRGKIEDTILNIFGGIRSSCTYVGAPSLKQLSKCTTFVKVTNQYNRTFVD